MKFIKKSGGIAALFLLLLLSGHAHAQGNTVVDKIIAKIDNYIILKSDLEKAYQSVLSSGELPGPNERCQLLQQLIVSKILVAKAEIDSVIVEDALIDQQLEQRMQYFVMQAGSEEKLERTLGKKLSELSEELRDQVAEQMTVERMRATVTTDISVTPAEVKKFFNKMPKDSIPFLSAEVKVGQIVRFPEISKEEKDKARNQLLIIKDQVEAGESFETLARKFSEDGGSAKNGGDLGWHGRGELVPEFEATALRLEPGQIADPIESEFGFHLIQLLERRGNRFRARHVLIRPKSSNKDVDRTTNKLDSVRTLVLQDSLTFENAAKDFSDDQPTRANAGFFKDQGTGSSMVPMDNLDPAIFFTLDTMQVGTISKPMTFRTQDGQTAARLIYYEKYIPPHYANLKDDYQKLYNAALNNKRNEVLREWLKLAKEEVFIEIDPEYAQCDITGEL